jgi:hypothetical protein
VLDKTCGCFRLPAPEPLLRACTRRCTQHKPAQAVPPKPTPHETKTTQLMSKHLHVTATFHCITQVPSRLAHKRCRQRHTTGRRAPNVAAAAVAHIPMHTSV